MAKMREVKQKAAKSKGEYTMVPTVIDGQTVMMKVLKPVAGPKQVTARCQG